jgi:receptor protein-tyrosine kinase
MFDPLETGSSSADPAAGDRSMGAILFFAGKLKADQVVRALRLQGEKGLRFGEACIELGYVTQGDIDSVLSSQYNYSYLRPGETKLDKELVAAFDPFSAKVEALRDLRTQLLLRWFRTGSRAIQLGAERKMLAIVSHDKGDGRTYLAANLAIVFSQLGGRTLLIDADLRHPRLHSLFNLRNRIGLSSVLAGRANGSAVERVAGLEKLSILPAGAAAPNPLELLSRPEFRDLLAAEAKFFDVVLIDTPAAEVSSDAQAIAARAGGALLVAREDRSRVEGVGRLRESIRSSHAEVVGCVLNRF